MKIRIYNLRDRSRETDLQELAARRLALPVKDVLSVDVVKKSMDGRGARPTRVWTLDVDVADPKTVLAAHQADNQGNTQ